VTILEVILNGYLSKEDIQQLARDRGLPTGRSKGELIDLLLSRHLDPAEPLSFLNVRALRDLCREFGLERTGDRDVITDRVLAAIREETPQWSKRPAPLLAVQTEKTDESSEPIPIRSESAGPWTVVGILTTVVAAGIYALVASENGLVWGVVASILVAAVIAVVLLRTHFWWHPRLAAFMGRPAE
jgi:hypothetical protein